MQESRRGALLYSKYIEFQHILTGNKHSRIFVMCFYRHYIFKCRTNTFKDIAQAVSLSVKKPIFQNNVLVGIK